MFEVGVTRTWHKRLNLNETFTNMDSVLTFSKELQSVTTYHKPPEIRTRRVYGNTMQLWYVGKSGTLV